MQALRSAIALQGRAIGTNIVKVDSFLNHRIDPGLMFQMGQAFATRFAQERPDLVLTVEVSGIALALATAHALGDIPLVFAKKHRAANQDGQYAQASVFSYTHKQHYHIRVDLNYLPKDARVLIVDDFLAEGQAVLGLISLVQQAQARLVGVGIGIEKGFQQGGSLLRGQGINLLSLAVIERISDGRIILKEN